MLNVIKTVGDAKESVKKLILNLKTSNRHLRKGRRQYSEKNSHTTGIKR